MVGGPTSGPQGPKGPTSSSSSPSAASLSRFISFNGINGPIFATPLRFMGRPILGLSRG